MTAMRDSQTVVEGLGAGVPNQRSSQSVLETLGSSVRNLRATQTVEEVLALAVRNHRNTQIVVEVLLVNLEIPVLPIFPDQSILPGLAFNVKWSPNFYNLATQTTVTGADIDLALADSPLHDFELTYEFLRDNCLQNTGSSEFKRMMGFFLRIGGTAGRFLFRNPDDNYVRGENLGTTDGATSVFGPVTRTFGIGEDSGTEPVGYIDLTKPSAVYLDGVWQDPATYQWLQTTPCDQQLKFNTTPSAGQTITADLGYFYYCKFPDNTNTFEKFMDRLWTLNSIKLHSCRPGA